MASGGTASVPSATAPSPLLQKAGDLEAIRTSVNDAATVSGGLWISYLFVMFYLTVAAGAVTHVDLFLERPVKLPFLGIDLPLLAFFCLAPVLFLIVHAYTLVHFVILSEKAKQFHQVLSEFDQAPQNGSASQRLRNEMRDNLRRQLSINVFVQFLAGPPEIRAGAFGWTLRAISWISLVIGPILLLLLFQVQFLPYQSVAITWVHRLSLMIDFVLLWWLWRKILAGRDPDSVAAPAVFTAVGMALSFLVILFSCVIVVFTGEWQAKWLAGLKVLPNASQPSRPLSIHDYIFNSTIDEISRKRLFPFSNTLILTNANIFEALGGEDPAKIKKREFLYRARGRNFRGAIFDHAILPKVDFYGAHLEGASFLEVDLDQSSFDKATMNNASLVRATGRGTSFEDVVLNGADLSGSNLEGADFARAALNGASFSSSELSGAKFLGAKLNGANLSSASIFGASFNCAVLSAAMFKNSAIDASYFVSARMDYANFSGANIAASDFTNADLSHLSSTDTKVAKVSVGQAAPDGEAKSVSEPSIFDKAKIDDTQFETNIDDLFKTKICSFKYGNIFMLNSEVFNKLSGPRVAPMIDYLLSNECSASAALTTEDRDRLRARRDAPVAEPYRNKFLECSAFGP